MACKGVLFVDLFFAFVQRVLNKKTAVLKKVTFFKFVKVCYLLCFWWQAIVGSELVFWINTKSQLELLQFSIEKSNNFVFFWILLAAIANAAPLLQMLWTNLDFSNLKLIRATWV